MSVLQRLLKPIFGRPWKPLAFPKSGVPAIPLDSKIEEETLPDYVASNFYPASIGEILQDRYQIVGKLGFGGTSTVWLARDLDEHKHVAVKFYIQSDCMGAQLDTELDVYKRIENAPKTHPGRTAVRTLLDSFRVEGPAGLHHCFVHSALWESVLDLQHRNPTERIPVPVVALVLKRLFHALDLLHSECRVAHTDIKEANILLGGDSAVFQEFENQQLTDPCPRKELPDRTIYVSRELGMPRDIGEPVLCDFGSATALDDGIEHREDIQPNIYRAPEVILDIPWTYSVDIWNAGCVVWDISQGESLFSGKDPELGTYRGRAHLAEMIALLGPPPESLLARAGLKSKFFSDSGQWTAGIPIPQSRPIESRETSLAEGGDAEDREAFLCLMRKMLQWEPTKRSTARELAEDEWILKHTA
ncbi:SRSF protein kinase 3 [Cercospora beticola]|uniref:SRSF protein kinase 3 n=1 Tax=Cercospora beticola TaxID=122368 RepID=A0A2G5I4L6_CERBT|nr:SRSF protein kinase 3 [Cercospora beticola]PIA99433.1 SRSF protein kinase 3 [Cercospora beticola]WPB00888.1 hypothetical protein RHO25_005508 [Cercospora beticola]CAK1360865.1 unnamed protein product [Cercospora beticola]